MWGYRNPATIKKIFVKCAVANGLAETLATTRLAGMWRRRTAAGGPQITVVKTGHSDSFHYT
ncbi:hypothetical protein CBM2592_A240003 [Cupriavidus taiwanensis]|nr:hypothetical protein CBM2588_A190004 [Cupriavidus taiwanensis]SOY51254.1 hypothetical protein CBM2592_A240003 [Cupriavidus taiwanensis]SOY83948.1 hypothetical protein CBM2591_A280003 [Cupriavidus taiwanensis]SOZ58217.1 hypothetical protein CBM2617_A280004 [Cupriavidus taiwanensis]SOZ79907.1 hypothetical protein CBM2618_A240004 [Cupriavidus taiwanensis]